MTHPCCEHCGFMCPGELFGHTAPCLRVLCRAPAATDRTLN